MVVCGWVLLAALAAAGAVEGAKALTHHTKSAFHKLHKPKPRPIQARPGK